MHRLTLNGRLSWPFWILVLILVVGMGLRLYGTDWDSGYGFHPDERDIYMRSGCMYELLTEAPGYQNCGYVRDQPEAEPGLSGLGTLLDAERSPLNPHWFPLGSILIYVMVLFRYVVELFTDINALEMRFVGRPLSALADVGTIFLVFVLGRRMFGQRVGLLASALTALAVIHIQNSHFYRPETFSVLFTLGSFWAMLRMVERRRLRDSVLLGLMVGLALAPKVSILPLLLPLSLAYWYRVLDSVNGRWPDINGEVVQRTAGHAVVAGAVAAAVFFLSAPYALLDAGEFVGDLLAQANMARHAGLWPFTIQYIGTPPFLYQVQQSAVWGLGLPLGVVAWIAIPFTAVLALRRRPTRRADLLLLAWVVPSLLFLESFEVRFLRYVFPLMPFMILMGARMLLWLAEALRPAARPPELPQRHRVIEKINSLVRRLRGFPGLAWLPVGLAVLVVGATAFYALAFEKVYSRDHPAVTASLWFKDNVASRTPIVSDNHWDEFIPDLYRYRVWQFPVYDPDTEQKMSTLAEHLASSEYLVFYSGRPYGSVAQALERFPLSGGYYRQLFAGGLGYRLERIFASYPELAGVAFRDDPFGRAGLPRPEPLVSGQSAPVTLDLGYADDNVVGYDHPQVLVFHNNERLSEEEIRVRLLGGPSWEPPSPAVGLMLPAEEKAVQQSGGTWSKIVHRDSWTNRLPVLAWLLVVEMAYLVTLPLTMLIFRPLPDRGIVLARMLGLLGVSYAAWLLVSLGWIDFSRTALLIGFLAMGSLSSLVLLTRWREIKQFLIQHWRLLLLGEVLFISAFLAFAALRAANPDLWHPWRGGEKPMEMAYLNAVIRSTSLPPFDPWFAGGYLNYYYWGYFVLAGLIRVTGILPTTAFNLAVPLFFALTVTGAYSLVYNLAEGVRRTQSPIGEGERAAAGESTGGESQRSRWLWTPAGAGLVAGLFTAVIGNLDGMVQVVQGAWYKLADGRSFPPFDFWRSSRMLPFQENFDPSPLLFWVPDKIPGAPDMSSHITEFPFFTFLFADLHAHLMVIPFTLLVIGLGLNLVVGLRNNGYLWAMAAAAALSLALGALWVVNSWDYPSYLLLTLALLGLAVYFKPGPVSVRLALLVSLTTGVLALSILAFLPFHQAYEAFNTGIEASKWRTSIDRFLGIHGLFLFIIATFLIYQARFVLKGVLGIWARPPATGEPAAGSGGGAFQLSAPKAGLTLVLLAAVLLAVTGYWTAVLLLVFLMLLGTAGLEVLRSQDRDRPFASVPLVLLGMALAIGIGVDLIRLQGDIGRMNTFFKYYLEVWVLLSIVSAYMLWSLGSQGMFRCWNWWKGAWMLALVLLIGSSLVYTVLGTRARVGDRFNPEPMTLDGTAYMERAVHWEKDQSLGLKSDREAIRWLQDNVAGSPVVLEAHNEQYHWSSRIADYTGLPTVLGWPWHQLQQRWDYQSEVRVRAAHIREMYETASLRRAEALLRQYDIKYIVVGELERIYYNTTGLGKFSRMAEKGLLEPVFLSEGVVIYETKWIPETAKVPVN
jgi:YYY domain-containing protein